MKKLLLSAMIIAAAITSCSKKTADIDNNEGKVEIKLSSGIAVSKAALDNTSAVTGLVFRRYEEPGYIYYNGPLFTGNRATDGKIIFDVPQYYENMVKMCSYYPAGTNNAAKDKVIWDIDGKTDIILTGITEIGAGPTPTEPLMYQHVLAMVEVVCKAETGKDAGVQSRWGKVVGLKLKNTSPQIVGSVFWQEDNVSGPFSSPQGTPTEIALWNANFEAFAPITLTDANAAVQSRGMFAPNKGVLDLVITTQRDGGNPTDKELKITLPGAAEFKAGFKHLLTLTFKASLLEEIEVTSTIKDWEVGTGASGDVD